MALRATCVRAFDVFYRRVPLTVLSSQPTVDHGHCLVFTSRGYVASLPPKKPAGAFFVFRNNKLEEIKRNNPDVGTLQASKIASQMWHVLDPEEKNRLLVSARADLADYRVRYENFLQSLSQEEQLQLEEDKKTRRLVLKRRRLKMELKKFGKPTRPLNAYMLFIRASRLERGSTPPAMFFKHLSECWRQMPAKEKEIYQDDALREVEKYKQAMTEWEERMKEIGREDLIRLRSQTPRKVVSTKAKKKSKKASTSKRKTSKTPSGNGRKKRTVSKQVQTDMDDEDHM